MTDESVSATAGRHGSGAFRRRHAMVVVDEHTVVAGVEDEMQRFELALTHNGSKVTDVAAHAVRVPWTTCPGATAALRAFEGLELTTDVSAVARWSDPTRQCTHQFDLLALAVAAAARSIAGQRGSRTYDTVVADWNEPPFVAAALRDGEPYLEWQVGPEAIEAPEAFAGRTLRGRFSNWCQERFGADVAEAATVLRMTVWMSPSRTMDLDGFADAESGGLVLGSCYTAQPERRPGARRSADALIDFGSSSDDLLSGFDPAAVLATDRSSPS